MDGFAYWIMDNGRLSAYWVLDILWAMGRNDLSAPLVELTGRNEIWECIGAWLFVCHDLDVSGNEISISKFAKLLNNSL